MTAIKHQCELMSLAEVWIEKSEQGWILNINETTTEQDHKKNNYLEEIGQTIYQVVNIKYCPYCGSKLAPINDRIVPSFEFYDFSKW